MNLGESWKGGLLPLPIMCHPELILRGVSSLNRGGELTLLELHPKKTLCLWGKVRKGWNPRSNIRRSLTKGVRDDTSCRLGRGLLPLPNLRHSEPHLRGVSSFNGEGLCPPPTSPKNDFMNLGKSWKGGETLVPILGDPSQKAFGTTLRVGSKVGLYPFRLNGGDVSLCSTYLRCTNAS